jgi:hypothetical protein
MQQQQQLQLLAYCPAPGHGVLLLWQLLAPSRLLLLLLRQLRLLLLVQQCWLQCRGARVLLLLVAAG